MESEDTDQAGCMPIFGLDKINFVSFALQWLYLHFN